MHAPATWHRRFPVSGGAFSYIMVHCVAAVLLCLGCTWHVLQCCRLARAACRAPMRLARWALRRRRDSTAPTPPVLCCGCAPQVTFGEFPAFVTLASLLLEYGMGECRRLCWWRPSK